MALDPNKKKPNDYSVLPGGINPATVGTRPAPPLLPSASDAGQGVGLLGRAGAVMAQIPAVAQRLLASKAGNAVADTASNFGSGVQSGFTGKPAAAAPLALPAAAKPFANYNGPLLAPSTAPAPVQAAPAVNQARSPAVPATTAGASAPVGGGAAPLPRPGTAYNDGSGAAYTTGDGRQGQLPAGVAVVRQKNGVNAFGATGASVAAATNQPMQSAPLAMPTATPNLNVQGLDLPSVNTSRVSDAERERAGLAKSLDDQLSRMGFEGLDSRGKRQFFSDLAGTRAGLSRQGGELAGSAAAQQLAAATQAGVATQGQVGDNNRALLSDQGQTTRAGISEQGANARAQLQSLTELNKPSQITDTAGNLLSVTGTQAAPVVGPDGKPVQPLQVKADGGITPAVSLDFIGKQLAALQSNPPVPGDPVAAAAWQSQISSLNDQAAALRSGGNAGSTRAPSPPANLQDFIAKAKAKNPGYTDQQLAEIYKTKYGK